MCFCILGYLKNSFEKRIFYLCFDSISRFTNWLKTAFILNFDKKLDSDLGSIYWIQTEADEQNMYTSRLEQYFKLI